jgi:hypothetical protein
MIKFEVLCNVEMKYVMNKWGGLVVKELNFIWGFLGSNFTNYIHCDQRWNIN